MRVVQCVHLKYSTIWKVDIRSYHSSTVHFYIYIKRTFYFLLCQIYKLQVAIDEFNLLLLLSALCKEFTWQGNGYLAQQDAHELYLAIASAIQTSTAHK